MEKQKYTLIKKISLTNDVYELHYKIEKSFKILSGQFMTFLIPDIWARAYSILEIKWHIVKLIIKKVCIKYWWRGGSIKWCISRDFWIRY